jgi:hypothetical protein
MTDVELAEMAEHNNFPSEHMPMLVQFGRYVLMAQRAFDLEGQAINIRAAISKEREACALTVEQAGIDGMGTLAAAAMIRKRGEK